MNTNSTTAPQIIDAPADLLAAIRATGISRPTALRMYGNTDLLTAKLDHVTDHAIQNIDAIKGRCDESEVEAEKIVLAGSVLVTGISTWMHQRTAVVPLRWGASRILVIPCGMHKVLGDDLKDEPFRAARLWRYQFCPNTDLVISTNKNDRGGFAAFSPTVNRLVAALVQMTYSVKVPA